LKIPKTLYSKIKVVADSNSKTLDETITQVLEDIFSDETIKYLE